MTQRVGSVSGIASSVSLNKDSIDLFTGSDDEAAVDGIAAPDTRLADGAAAVATRLTDEDSKGLNSM